MTIFCSIFFQFALIPDFFFVEIVSKNYSMVLLFKNSSILAIDSIKSAFFAENAHTAEKGEKLYCNNKWISIVSAQVTQKPRDFFFLSFSFLLGGKWMSKWMSKWVREACQSCFLQRKCLPHGQKRWQTAVPPAVARLKNEY